MVPIYATSTYVQESPGKHKGYEYSRTRNPTRDAYEKCVVLFADGIRNYLTKFVDDNWMKEQGFL